jgi:hypothetical protein
MKKWYAICLGIMFLGVSLHSRAAEDRQTSVVKNPNSPSYFDTTINDSGLLHGKYNGWCGNWSTEIGQNVLYNANFYSSYNPNLPVGLVDHPDHLDEVNWLLNQHFMNKPSPTGLGVYTVGDVQLSIWTLLDDSFDSSTLGPFSQARVDELVAKALALGADYKPRCKDIIAILLEPSDPDTGTRAQTVIVEIGLQHFPKCVVPDDDSDAL